MNSGRSVIESPERSSNEYISLATTSVDLAHRPREYLGRLDQRNFDPLEPVQAAHAVERGDHFMEAVGFFPKQALRAPDRLRCLDLRHSGRR